MDNWSYDSDVSVRYLWIFLVKKYTCIGFSRLSTKASLFCEKNYLTLSIEKKWIVKIKKKKLIFLNRIDTKMWTFYLVFFLKWCVVCFISGWCNILANLIIKFSESFHLAKLHLIQQSVVFSLQKFWHFLVYYREVQTFVDLIIDALLYVPKKSEIHRSCHTVLKSSNRQTKDSPCVAHRKPVQTVYSQHCLNSSYKVNHEEKSGNFTG